MVVGVVIVVVVVMVVVVIVVLVIELVAAAVVAAVVSVVLVLVVKVSVVGVRHLSPRKYRLNVAAFCGTTSNGRNTPCSLYNTHAKNFVVVLE